jgi:hypothetical protein
MGDPDGLLGSGGIDTLVQDCHCAHDETFAFSDPQSPIEVVAWRAAVSSAVQGGGKQRADGMGVRDI